VSRRSHIVRTQQQARARSLPRPPEQGANPAFATFTGEVVAPPSEGWHDLDIQVVRLFPSQWWQSPRLDPYISQGELEHVSEPIWSVRVLQDCDLMVTFRAGWETEPLDGAPLQEDYEWTDEPGYVWPGYKIGHNDWWTVGSVDYQNGAHRQVHVGPWARTAFPSDRRLWVAETTVSEQHNFKPLGGSDTPTPGYDPYITIIPYLHNAMLNHVLYGWWKLTVMLLDESTERELGGIG
jgi:hypothetical protein